MRGPRWRRRRSAACRSASTCTSRSAGSVPFLLLPRLHRQERAGGRGSISTCSRANGSCMQRSRPSPAGRSTSSTSAAARRRSSRPRSSQRLVTRLTGGDAVGAAPRKSRSSASRARSPRPSWRRSARMGVTRLSLGVENFDDRILEINGRAHRSPEIDRVYRVRARARLPADQHRPDRRHARRDRRELARLRPSGRSTLEPDSVTIYQMELPFNTTISQDLLKRHADSSPSRSRAGRPSAAGCTRRSKRWSAPATTSAAPTPPCKDPSQTTLRLSRSALAGRRLAGLGVASFGHVNGVHMQNLDSGTPTARRSSAARFRSAAPTGRPTKSG